MATFTPPYERRNVLTGLASMFSQPAAATEDDPAPAPPEDIVPLGGDWTTVPDQEWVALGASQEGLNFGFTRETNDIMIEEQPNPVDVRTESLQFNAAVTLAEDTFETMRIAYGGGTIVDVPATTTEWGYQTLEVSDEMEDFAFGFEGENQFNLARRIVLPVVKSIGEIETTYRRSEEQRLYAVSFRSLTPLSECTFRNVTGPPTGTTP